MQTCLEQEYITSSLIESQSEYLRTPCVVGPGGKNPKQETQGRGE